MFWTNFFHKTGYGFGFGTGMGLSYWLFNSSVRNNQKRIQ